ncbi:MAG: hypothetical protein CM1200mP18_17240 [Gammaproteobacteria bacterium]|nr:MAG: hypothetical protein CM1200mP18_17240 [Gammaproteobacteria bacterium]
MDLPTQVIPYPAAALANMDIIEGEGLLEHPREFGPYLQKQCQR